MQGGANVSAPYKKFGAWLGRTVNTVYQAPSDGLVVAWAIIGQSSFYLKGFTDGSNPPVTELARENSNSGNLDEGTITFPVRKNDYWKVTSTQTTTINWLPLEP